MIPRQRGAAEQPSGDADASGRTGPDTSAGAGPKRRKRRRVVRPGVGGDPIISGLSADDSDVGWHESSGEAANDERLRRDVPPHW